MTTKFTRAEIMISLLDFSKESYNKYGSYSYAAGFYESSLASLVADLPRAKQAEFMRILEQTTKANKE